MKITGGDKFISKMLELAEKVKSPATLRVGFFERSKYPDGTPVAMVAAIHNYGAPNAGIPPRPFFSNMIADKSGEWPDAIAGLLKSTGYDVQTTLERTGAAIAGQLVDSINNGSYVPLKPTTVARKGFDKPLIDTGYMISRVEYEVKSS